MKTLAIMVAMAASALVTIPAAAQTIGVSMANFDDRFLTTLRAGMAARAKELGVKIQFEDAQVDIGKQLNHIQNFTAQKVSAMIVNTVDTSATPRMTKLASAAGIPLVYVNRKPDETKLPKGVVFVGSDENVSGKLEGEEIARLLGNKGNVVIMMGELSNNSTAMRTKGIENVVAQHPGMKIIEKQTANYQRTEGMNLMSNWLLSGKKIDAIASNNDEMAIGAIRALQQAGKDPRKYVIGGVDATSDALVEMEKGNLAVTVFQDARTQGRLAVDAAVKLAKGEKVEAFVWIPFELVTKSNYKTYINK